MFLTSTEGILFAKADWFSVSEHQKRALTSELDALEGNRLLNTSVDDLVKYFVEKYWINVPRLIEEEITADQKEVELDSSQYTIGGYLSYRGRPVLIKGTSIEIEIPFDGDEQMFFVQPTTFTLNPPRASVKNQNLLITIMGQNLEVTKVKGEIDQLIKEIKEHLDRLRQDSSGFNQQLEGIAKNRIEKRRQKLLEDQNLVSALGFPLKQRKDAIKTYRAPEVRRKLKPALPKASCTPYKPEPALDMEDYEHILSVIENMTLVMEKSPSAFSSLDEESLRTHFLVQLNGHYEGQASAETFNYEGKTDILIRSEGKNIFIAECKYWSGPKKLAETIDQLLGYTSWRDTKVAIILFNRNKDFSRVLESIPTTITGHTNYKKDLGKTSESSFRYVFAHRDDPNREMTLTVMAFDVPHRL